MSYSLSVNTCLRIGVILPVYNEEKYISRCLGSLLNQTLRPSQIVICDNESTDNSIQMADAILSSNDIPYKIVTQPKRSLLHKGNINHVYWKASRYLQQNLDFIACLECDVILDKKYYEKIVETFRKDPKIGLACGVLLPLNFPESFPLSHPHKMVWGANRVYSYSCWIELTCAFDLRLLPAWDTDQNILAVLKGWKISQVNEAVSWHCREITTYHGISKGVKYRLIGYPFWWTIYRAIKDFDPGLLVGYACMTIWHTPSSPLKTIYQQALMSKLRKAINRYLSH